MNQAAKDKMDAFFEEQKKVVCFYCTGRGHNLDQCDRVRILKELATMLHDPTKFDLLIEARVTETKVEIEASGAASAPNAAWDPSQNDKIKSVIVSN